jgi:hypothetical protein
MNNAESNLVYSWPKQRDPSSYDYKDFAPHSNSFHYSTLEKKSSSINMLFQCNFIIVRVTLREYIFGLRIRISFKQKKNIKI